MLGAALNIAVAFSCCLWIQQPLVTRANYLEEWPRPVSPFWQRWADVEVRRAFGFRDSSAIGDKEGEWQLNQGKQYTLDCGFPWFSLRRTLWREEPLIEKTPLDAREPVGPHEGILIPGIAHALGARRTIVPIMPLWPGFALGSIFYATLLWLCVFHFRRAAVLLRDSWFHRHWNAQFASSALAGTISVLLTIVIAWVTMGNLQRSAWFVGPAAPSWPCTVPHSWPGPPWTSLCIATAAHRWQFSTRREFPPPSRRDEFENPQRDAGFHVFQTSSGWPFPALTRFDGWEQVSDRTSRRLVRTTPLDLALLNRGIHIPGPRKSWNLTLPLRPLWPGFLLDALLYTAVISALLHLTTIARRSLRVRRNLCTRCSYPRAGLAPDLPCPECGAIRGMSLPPRADLPSSAAAPR